jgi:hypothetical protein
VNDAIAQQLLAKVMAWHQPEQPELVEQFFPDLQLLASYKYDSYQQFGPGKRFIESLALWLNQLRLSDRLTALEFVKSRLVYISDAEFFHLVQIAYPDVIVPERMRLVAEENGFAAHQVGRMSSHPRFRELGLKSLYLGLSDGSRTSEIRRASNGEIGNEQIWQAYELGSAKGEDLLKELSKSLKLAKLPDEGQRFTLIWLLDDFSASGNTYIRFENGEFKGKLRKIFDNLHRDGLVDRSHYEVFLLLYVATRQAVDHIEYWCERFTSANGYKPLQVRVIHELDTNVSIDFASNPLLQALVDDNDYYDQQAETNHTRVGGTTHVRRGFANCALPVVLGHNTPNNSVYILWGEETFTFRGLFPRISRHREG